VEGYITDIAFVLSEIEAMLKHLAKWNRPSGSVPLVTCPPVPGCSRTTRRGPGIAPWNYRPAAAGPGGGALAAGNTVVMKPSEVSAATSALLARLVPQYLDPSAIALVEAACPRPPHCWRSASTTSSTRATDGRRVVMAAAPAPHPGDPRLGGKSPVIVDRSANLR